jgi:ubiquinone/menaquinone biosynthesis C-methylase UbiE
MSTSPESRREQPSTYFVQDRGNRDEIKRLRAQDQMMTESMGGVLSEQPDPTIFQRVLDIGCGTGGWLIQLVRTYPGVTRAVGIDISNKMIEYARSQAQAQGADERIEFRLMDVLRPLEFADDSFDLVNMRFGQSYLRKWDWPNVLGEFRRVTRSGGVIRLTDSDLRVGTSSTALARLGELSFEALYKAGHSFTPEGVTTEFVHLLTQYAGTTDTQTRIYTGEYRPGTPQGEYFYEDMKHMYRTLLPFMRKWTRVPDDYEQIYRQALTEIQQPDSVTKWNLVTAWGTISVKK